MFSEPAHQPRPVPGSEWDDDYQQPEAVRVRQLKLNAEAIMRETGSLRITADVLGITPAKAATLVGVAPEPPVAKPRKRRRSRKHVEA